MTDEEPKEEKPQKNLKESKYFSVWFWSLKIILENENVNGKKTKLLQESLIFSFELSIKEKKPIVTCQSDFF